MSVMVTIHAVVGDDDRTETRTVVRADDAESLLGVITDTLRRIWNDIDQRVDVLIEIVPQ